MKLTKTNSMKMLINFSFFIILLTSACAESSKSTKTEATVDPPKINIQSAVMSGNLEAVKQHIEAGTDLNEKDPMSGSTPLITAVSFGKDEIAKALIDADADLSLKNNDGSTALHSAAFFCHVEIVQMLIDAKADKTLLNNFGATPRETVMGPFAEIKPFYEMLQQQLQPLGLQIDLVKVEKTRPVIAIMLQ